MTLSRQGGGIGLADVLMRQMSKNKSAVPGDTPAATTDPEAKVATPTAAVTRRQPVCTFQWPAAVVGGAGGAGTEVRGRAAIKMTWHCSISGVWPCPPKADGPVCWQALCRRLTQHARSCRPRAGSAPTRRWAPCAQGSRQPMVSAAVAQGRMQVYRPLRWPSRPWRPRKSL